jgi:stalled ribosome rescue protein Dom34
MQLKILSRYKIILKMTKSINLGIWMDHASAHIMEFSPDSMDIKTIESIFTNHENQHRTSKGEKLMHNKEQQSQAEYYHKLGEVIRNYEAVVLFGPTDAKTELFNILRKDQHFDNIKIDVSPSDKMTENQQYAFVKSHFFETPKAHL